MATFIIRGVAWVRPQAQNTWHGQRTRCTKGFASEDLFQSGQRLGFASQQQLRFGEFNALWLVRTRDWKTDFEARR
jgi:hypothetical protein